MYTLCVFVQIYIVSGGHSGSDSLASTENRDPGEGGGQRLAVCGQPALSKKWSQRRGTGQWTVHGNWSVKFNKIDNICILYIQHDFYA